MKQDAQTEPVQVAAPNSDQNGVGPAPCHWTMGGLQTEGRFHVPSETSLCRGEELRLSQERGTQREKRGTSINQSQQPSSLPRVESFQDWPRVAGSRALVGLCTDGEGGRLIPPCPLPISYIARGNSSSSRGGQITAEEVLG